MRYATATAFRTALEQRLRTRSIETGLTLTRLRKAVVFDRLLARLLVDAAGQWLVKGGMALDFRLGARARATKDLDLARRDDDMEGTGGIVVASAVDLDDYFTFSVQKQRTIEAALEDVAVRYRVSAILDDRRFEQVTVDIGLRSSAVPMPELLLGSDLVVFAGIPRITVPALPLALHVAEKIHAYARVYAGERQTAGSKI